MITDTREKIYNKITARWQWAWRPLRYVLWGKFDLNNPKVWESAYADITDKEIETLTQRIPNLVNAAVEIAKPYDSILEISAGYGNFILKLSPSKKRFATEYSDAAIQYLRQCKIETKKTILPSLPYLEESADIVVAISVFEHLSTEKEIRESFKSCHHVCRKGMILSVPYQCMQPWNTPIHNFDFSKDDIQHFTDGLFKMTSWGVYKDNVTHRSIAFLEKI